MTLRTASARPPLSAAARSARLVFLTLTVTRWFPLGLVVGISALWPLQRGLTVPESLSASAFMGLTVFLLELPLSGILQRFPARWVIALGFGLVGIGFGATGLATSFVAIAATIVVWTLGEIAIAPVSSAYVAELSPPHLRGRFMGAWGLTWSVGLALGPALTIGDVRQGVRPPRPAPMAARTGAASPTPLPDVPLGVQRVEVTATVVFALGAGRP